MSADDQAQLTIGDEIIVQNTKNNFPQEKMGALPLKAGLHKINLKYYTNDKKQILRLYISGSDLPKKGIALENLLY